MILKRKRFIVLLALVVLVAAYFILTAPKHARVDADIPVGEEVMLTSQGTPLAASLLMPGAAEGRRVPGVVMIVGSGSFSFRIAWKPGEFPLWKSISQAFLAKGYAVLLLEKKGVNRSGGHWERQTFHDRAEDAVAGVRYLRSRPDVDPARVGVCGHSQGGWIAQLAAAVDPEEVAFVVSLAGPNISVKQQIIDDQENEWRCAGVAEEKIAGKTRWLRTKLNILAALSHVLNLGALSPIIDYDPNAENVAARIRCPLLAVYGEHDRLVVPANNIPLLERGLRAGGNTRFKVVIIAAGSHGFVRTAGRCPQSFDGVPPIAPEFFEALAAWDPFSD